MTPSKKIPSFCFKYPWLKVFTFVINSIPVDTGVRRLRGLWTPELAQDVSAFHNIDAEAELTALLSEQVAAEIDRNIINTINQDLVMVQPMAMPLGELFYFDFGYEELSHILYKDGSTSLGNTFISSIGFETEIRPHTFT